MRAKHGSEGVHNRCYLCRNKRGDAYRERRRREQRLGMVLGGLVCGVLLGGRLLFREAAIERGRGVKREQRRPTRRELLQLTSRRPVLRRLAHNTNPACPPHPDHSPSGPGQSEGERMILDTLKTIVGWILLVFGVGVVAVTLGFFIALVVATIRAVVDRKRQDG